VQGSPRPLSDPHTATHARRASAVPALASRSGPARAVRPQAKQLTRRHGPSNVGAPQTGTHAQHLGTSRGHPAPRHTAVRTSGAGAQRPRLARRRAGFGGIGRGGGGAEDCGDMRGGNEGSGSSGEGGSSGDALRRDAAAARRAASCCRCCRRHRRNRRAVAVAAGALLATHALDT
jgi:hypothetical protein